MSLSNLTPDILDILDADGVASLSIEEMALLQAMNKEDADLTKFRASKLSAALATKCDDLEKEQRDIDVQLHARDGHTGTCSFLVGGQPVKVTRAKKYDVDQDKIAAVATNMEDQALARILVKRRFSLNGTAYANQPQAIKDKFADAITLKPGSPVYDLSRVGAE